MCQKYLLAVVLAHNTCSQSAELINFLRHDFCTKLLLFLYFGLQPNALKFPHHCGPLVTRSPRRAWILIDTSSLEKQLSIHSLFLVGQECHLSSMNVRGRTGGPWSQRNKIQVPVAPFSCATLAKPTMPYEIHFPHL